MTRIKRQFFYIYICSFSTMFVEAFILSLVILSELFELALCQSLSRCGAAIGLGPVAMHTSDDSTLIVLKSFSCIPHIHRGLAVRAKNISLAALANLSLLSKRWGHLVPVFCIYSCVITITARFTPSLIRSCWPRITGSRAFVNTDDNVCDIFSCKKNYRNYSVRYCLTSNLH